MEKVSDTQLEEQLQKRRKRLQTVISESGGDKPLIHLLREVDTALDKIRKRKYGLCETCDEPIENERLAVDPLIRNCLDHLTAGEQRMLEHDLDLAYQIQNKLLPEQALTVGRWTTFYHYEAAGPVSGDYCDLIVLPNGQDSLLFLIGDVAGKGVSASMLMAHLHAIFRSLIMSNLPIPQMVEHANRLFCEGTMLTHFATLVCGVAHESGEVEICNAGHCPPLIIREKHIESTPSTGLPLGMFCASQYSTVKVNLTSEDSLFLYSDGLSEARNDSNIQYGEGRLKALVEKKRASSPQDLIAACLEDLRNFRSDASMLDDLTMLAIQRK